MITILGIIVIVLLIILSIFLLYFVPLRKTEKGFEYVYVEEDGSVRELSREEQD